MGNRKVRKIKVIALLLGILFSLETTVFAASFQIDKAKVRVRLPSGWNDSGEITVTNQDDEPVKIRVYVADWKYSDSDGSKDFFAPATMPHSCADWIKFYPADFTIPSKGSQKVNFVVGVPQGATGGHYAVLFFESRLAEIVDEDEGSKVQILNRLGSLFYVEAEGTVQRKAELSNFTISFVEDGLSMGVTFKNTGNVDIATKGTIDVVDKAGFVLTRGSFNDAYTLGGDEASLSATIANPNFAQGTFDVILTFDLGEGAILVGNWQIETAKDGSIATAKKVD